MSADLIDYLRDKLEHAEICSCPMVDVTNSTDTHPHSIGSWSRSCPVHGPAGPAPNVYAVRSNVPDPELARLVRVGARLQYARATIMAIVTVCTLIAVCGVLGLIPLPTL